MRVLLYEAISGISFILCMGIVQVRTSSKLTAAGKIASSNFNLKQTTKLSILSEDFVAVYIPGYVDWIFTTPLMLIELGILAGARPVQTITLIVTWLLIRFNQFVQSENV